MGRCKVWAHWNHSFDIHFSCLGPVSWFSPSHRGASLGRLQWMLAWWRHHPLFTGNGGWLSLSVLSVHLCSDICGTDSYNWSPWITRSVHFKMILTDIGHHFDRHRHQIWFVLWQWYQTLSAILVLGLWIQAPHFPYSTPLGLSSSESSSCHVFTLLPSHSPYPSVSHSIPFKNLSPLGYFNFP